MDCRWCHNIYIIYESMAFCLPILLNPLIVCDLYSRDHTLNGRLECIAQIWHIRPDMPFKAAWLSSGHFHCILLKSGIWKNLWWFVRLFFLILFAENVHIFLLRHWYFTSAIIIIVKEFLCSPVYVLKLLHLKKSLNDLLTISEGVCLLCWLWCHYNLGFTSYHLPPGTGQYTMG